MCGADFLLASLQLWSRFVASSRRTENASGEVSVSGGTDLKSSQHYPPLFGQSVAELLVARKARVVLLKPS